MRQDIIDTLNDPTLIQAREYQMDRLTRLFSGEEEGPLRIAGCRSGSPKDPFLDPEGWAEDCLTGLALQAEQLLDKEVFHPLCAEYWFYGVHFTDRVFGAPVQAKDDLFWTPGVENEIGELPVPDLERNETWKTAQRLTEALVSFGAKAPFIATQVLGEPWNQTFNLYRERGLIGFFDDPVGMKRDLGVVTDTLVEMHKWFIGHIPPDQFQPICPAGRCQPRGFGQMCGCSTHLISNTIYEEFIRPQDERVLALYPNGGMLHLCGHHTQHLPSWRDMPCIRAMQVNDAATDQLADYYRGTRPDQILYVCPTPTVGEADAIRITEGGRRLVLV